MGRLTVLEQIAQDIAAEFGNDCEVVIHMDPIDVNDEHINALREQVDGVLRGIDEKLSMHDFRVVDGERQINLIFDMVVPFEYDEEEKNNLQLQLMEKLQEIDKRYQCVITMEHSYKAHV